MLTFYFPHTRFWELMCGSILAWSFANKAVRDDGLKSKINSSIDKFLKKITKAVYFTTRSNLLSLSGLLLCIFGVFYIDNQFRFPGIWAIVPVSGAVLIILAEPEAWLNRVVLSNRVSVWFGLISYPLYLWQWPLLSFARIIEGDIPDEKIQLSAVFVSIFLAWLIYDFAERPIRFGKQTKLLMPILVVSMLVIGGVGYITYQYDGFVHRAIAKNGAFITNAKLDWEFESTGLVDGMIVNMAYYEGQKPEAVLFIGSSVMGQYNSRVKQVYSGSNKPAFSAIFAARVHCHTFPLNPVVSRPENIKCADYYQAALKLARDNPVVTKVVFGSNWPKFMLDDKLNERGEIFVKDLLELRKLSKEIVIISNSPSNKRFSLSKLSKLFRKRLEFKLPDTFVERNKIERIRPISELKYISEVTGATFINPFDYLCDFDKCPITRQGLPLYRDNNHITASFARSNALFIDELLGN